VKNKKNLLIGMIAAVLMVILSGCNTAGGQTKVTLNEAVHSAFYAPLYVAVDKGYFKEERIKLEINTVSGTDQALASLLADECDIALMGTQAGIGVYNEGTRDYPVCFAQLTQRAGDMLVSKILNEDFTWNNLVGKRVIVGEAGSMPQMVFDYVLKKQGVNPKTDLKVIKDINIDQAAQAFTAGDGDYVVLFEPEATTLELEGKGKVVAALGMVSGRVPYTAFMAKKSYLGKNQELAGRFTKAVQKGLDFVLSHTPEETAKVIEAQFPETDREALTLILTGYYKQDTWKGNLIFEEKSYTLLMDLMEDSGELLKQVPYEDAVNTEFARKAVEE
jgi:NitT/TauT family transport system substrate-binding protein